MIAIVDYGVGNLFSLRSSFAFIGKEARVTGDAREMRSAEGLVLPGVGAFGDAARKLREAGLWQPLLDCVREGKPLLGVCLGMQLLFEDSAEFGCHQGLGLIPGHIVPLKGKIPAEMKIPHIGWNALDIRDAACPLLKYTRRGEHVYFVHSFYADTRAEDVKATAEYCVDVPAVVQRGRVYGCQFHPEKSGPVGLNMLRAFCEEADAC